MQRGAHWHWTRAWVAAFAMRTAPWRRRRAIWTTAIGCPRTSSAPPARWPVVAGRLLTHPLTQASRHCASPKALSVAPIAHAAATSARWGWTFKTCGQPLAPTWLLRACQRQRSGCKHARSWRGPMPCTAMSGRTAFRTRTRWMRHSQPTAPASHTACSARPALTSVRWWPTAQSRGALSI